METKTREQWMRDAVAHERAARWSQAALCRTRALAAAGNERPVVKSVARGEPDLAPGTVLRHVSWGKVKAECLVAGAGDFRVAGQSYPTLTDAARAAGAGNYKIHVQRFWGLDKQELFDRRGFEQTRNDTDLDEDAEIEPEEPDFSAAFADAQDDDANEIDA